MVGEEGHSFSALRIDVTDTLQSLQVVEFPFPGAQSNPLVAAQSGCLFDR